MTIDARPQASLRSLNTFGVEARAEQLLELQHAGQIPALLECIRGRPRFVLGAGSNVLFTRDWPGVLIRVGLTGRQCLSDRSTEAHDDAPPESVLVEAAAGEAWSDFVRWTLAQGLFGLENLSMIPGSVGAAPIQNIGAYGVEQQACFDSLEALHLDSGERRRFRHTDCRFGYRDSRFKASEGKHWLVLSVRYRLSRKARICLDYTELREALMRKGMAEPRPTDVAQAVCELRRSKLPDPALIGNAGSFFRNPVLEAGQAERLLAQHPGVPAWPEADRSRRIKIAAGWLIEQCGWKGWREGDAGVHERHALVLVNHGEARGASIAALAQRIQASVLERFGVTLEPEAVIV